MLGILVSILATLALIVIAMPVGHDKDSVRRTACLGNLQEEALALLTYAADNDDRLPFADRWANAAFSQTRADKWSDINEFRCPVLTDDAAFGHAFHDGLSRKTIASQADPYHTPMLFDSTDVRWNAHGGFVLLPAAGRHPREKNAIAYLDGHVSRKTRAEIFQEVASRK